MKKFHFVLVMLVVCLVTCLSAGGAESGTRMFWLTPELKENRRILLLPGLGEENGSVLALAAEEGLEQRNPSDGADYTYFFADDHRRIRIGLLRTQMRSPEEARHIYEDMKMEEISVNTLPGLAVKFTETEGISVRYHMDAYLSFEEGVVQIAVSADSKADRDDCLNALFQMQLSSSPESENENWDSDNGVTEQEGAGAGFTGVCKGKQVNVRTEPSMSAPSIGQLNRGDGLTVLEDQGEWSRIECSLGIGYIRTQYIEPYSR